MLVFNLDKITLLHFSGKTKAAIESEDIVLELPSVWKMCGIVWADTPSAYWWTIYSHIQSTVERISMVEGQRHIYWVSVVSNLHASSSTQQQAWAAVAI